MILPRMGHLATGLPVTLISLALAAGAMLLLRL
jgi:hypothetical protein